MSFTASGDAPRDRSHSGQVSRSYSAHRAKAVGEARGSPSSRGSSPTYRSSSSAGVVICSAGFQDDDRCAGLVKKISRAQAGETGADDDNGLVGIGRARGDVANGGDGERKPARHLLKKSSAIHVLRLFWKWRALSVTRGEYY